MNALNPQNTSVPTSEATIFEVYPKLLDLDWCKEFNFATCWTFMNPDFAFEELDVAVALILARANMSNAARALGRSRRTLHSYVVRTPRLRVLLEDIREEFLDTIEEMCMDDALGEDSVARWRFLQTQGKSRGYSTTGPSSADKEGDKGQFEAIERDAADFMQRMSVMAGRKDLTVIEGSANPK